MFTITLKDGTKIIAVTMTALLTGISYTSYLFDGKRWIGAGNVKSIKYQATAKG